MIFVTLGTQDKKFPRLLQAVEQINTDERIIIQTGSTEYKSNKKNIKIYKYLSQEDFLDNMMRAEVIISHAGVGTIIQGLKLHKKMIVAARLKKYKEHVNDHQMQILKTFSEDGYILPLNNFDDLEKLINTEFTPKEFKPNNQNFVKKLDKEINNLTKRKGAK
ncbi:MAG: glycosyl transferase family 28 [Clostridia bacterium]|nr:glycosyl transferase family 28 [Clostridia bacterium]